MNYDELFNTSGKIPTDSDFWFKEVDFGGENGITPFFSKVIGEQVYKPLKRPYLRMYEEFAGAPITAGTGWQERIVKKTIAKHFKPKADAADDLKFYDNGGYEFNYKVNFAGWIPVTLPSELATLEDVLKPESVGTFNGQLVDNVVMAYQRAMESAIGKKLVSTAGNKKTLTYGNAKELIQQINDIVVEMKGTKVHYNDLGLDPGGTEYYNDNIYTNSDRVLIFIDAKQYNWLMSELAALPSPERIPIEGAKVIPLVDGLPTPLTAAEFTAGQSAQGWDPSESPAALGEAQPDILICSADRCVYRPLAGSYRVNLAKNNAGDFVNQHLLWKGGIAIRSSENCLRCYLSYNEDAADYRVKVINSEEEPVNTKEVRSVHTVAYVSTGHGTITGETSGKQGDEVSITDYYDEVA